MLLVLFTGALTVQVRTDAAPLTPSDRAVRDGIQHVASSSGGGWLDRPMHLLADLGGPLPGGLVLAASLGFSLWRSRSHTRALVRPVAVVAAAVGAVSVLVILGKQWIARPGPSGHPVTGDQWGYFPSGHTATSAVCFGCAALLARCVLPPGTAVRVCRTVVSVLCALIGFALLWCNYHWLGDVLAAWAVSGAALWWTAWMCPVTVVGSAGDQSSMATDTRDQPPERDG